MENRIIRDGKQYMDVVAIHKFLSEQSYWAKGISFEIVDKSLDHSFCVGCFIDDIQVGFGRVITDYYTFGWYADFYVLPAHRGKGIAKAMLTYISKQDWTKRLRRKMLNTSDGHELYRKFGFKELAHPTYIMEEYKPNIHLQYQSEISK